MTELVRDGRRVLRIASRCAGGMFGVLQVLILAMPAFAQADDGPTIVNLDWTGPRAVALIALLAFFIVSFFAWRPQVAGLIKGIAFWVGLFLVLLAVYAYRDRIDMVGREIASVVLPGETFEVAGGELIVNRRRGDHFRLRGTVDGHPVEFLFDTGASTVVLTERDARAAGYPVDLLDFTVPVMTANGTARVAPITISELVVGPIRITNVRAAVAPDEALAVSLLGNTFLNRLSGYSVSRDRLVLTP